MASSRLPQATKGSDAIFGTGLKGGWYVGRCDLNKIFEKLSDQLALFSIFLIYQYKSDKLFCEIFLGR